MKEDMLQSAVLCYAHSTALHTNEILFFSDCNIDQYKVRLLWHSDFEKKNAIWFENQIANYGRDLYESQKWFYVE